MAKAQETTTIIARLKNPSHPNGQKIRGWHKFTTEALSYDVTTQELEAIQSDDSILIMKWWKTSVADKAPANSWTTQTNQPTKKDEIIAKMVEKWLVAWNDFDVDASEEVLLKLLATAEVA